MADDENVMEIFKKLPEKVIPYRKEFRLIVGSVKASILWQQLEYWFYAMGSDSFYKFLAPLDEENYGYKEGDSWIEELGFSKCEFRSAFSKLGIAYKSKNEYSQQEDIFKGNMYCSYVDKIGRKTYYLRNTEIVKFNIQKLENLLYGTAVNVSPQVRKHDSEKVKKKSSTKSKKSISINTENTAEKTQRGTQEISSVYTPSETSSEGSTEKNIKKKELKKNSEDRREKTRRRLTKPEEVMILYLYKRYIYDNCNERMPSVVVGIRNALRLFEKKTMSSDYGLYALSGSIKLLSEDKFFAAEVRLNKLVTTPKRFWSIENIEAKLLPYADIIVRMNKTKEKKMLPYKQINQDLRMLYELHGIKKGTYFKKDDGEYY